MLKSIEERLFVEQALNLDTYAKSEDDLQVGCAKLLDGLGLLWMHVPNEGRRSGRYGAGLKRKGMKKGAPDILIFEWVQHRFGVAIELKYGSNKTSSEQDEWLQALIDRGWYAVVCSSMKEVVNVLRLNGFLPLEAK